MYLSVCLSVCLSVSARVGLLTLESFCNIYPATVVHDKNKKTKQNKTKAATVSKITVPGVGDITEEVE